MNNDSIADKMEEVIRQMCMNFESQQLGPSEYSIFHNPQKHSSWFIVIYFRDSISMKMAMKQGVCYEIYSYLLNELNRVPEISKTSRSISFEFGDRPTEKSDIESVLKELIAKSNSLEKVAGKRDIKLCGYCGHDFDKHELLGNLKNDKVAPTEGWITCPEENCNCFQTWSANYKTESTKTENKFGRVFKNLFK